MVDFVNSKDFVLNFAYGLIGLGVFVVVRMLVQEQESRAAQDNLGETWDRSAKNGLVRITRPFFTQYVVPMIRGKPYWDPRRKIFKRKLITAGLKDELTEDEFISFKIFLILFFPLVMGLLQAGGFLDVAWWVILGSGVVGWFYPDFWVKSRIDKRQKSILRSMPFIVDLLALSTEAGLDFIGAIGKVVEKANKSPLVEEFEQLLKELQVGSSRQEALRELAARVDMIQINSFVAVLISADQMGAPVGKVLRQQSEAIRSERMVRAEKAGVAASQMVILPLVFFIMPSVLLMVFGPFIVGWIYGPSGG